MAFSWVLTLFTLYLSRIREYYADRHSVSVVENGAEKLSTGLVTIVEESKRGGKQNKQQKKATVRLKHYSSLTLTEQTPTQQTYTQHKMADKNELLTETLAKKPTHRQITSLKSSQLTQT